jgi:orotidine-5'-phosphate decarboxylase
LNVGDRDRALQWLGRLGKRVDCYKLQMDLFGRAGPGLVREFVGSGVEVFLDLKFHDIPSVVANAVRTAGEMGVNLLTVHATGGEEMMKQAAAAAREFGDNRPRVLGVTVLTSLGDAELARVFGCAQPAAERVLALARLARDSGCDGVVCSPQEVRQVKDACGPEFLAVCPGIRPGEQGGRRKAEGGTRQTEDQARVATPASAARDGADYIVVGRPIYKADDPLAAAAEIRRQLEGNDG